jgi:hypothetical protein
MKKVILLSLLLVLAMTGVFAQSNNTIADLRKELHAYIDAIPEQNLSSLKPLLAILAEPVSISNKNELYEMLDAIPPRNIDAVKALLLALADPSYNTAVETSQSQAKPAETAKPAATATSASAKTNEPARTGKFSVGGGAFFDWNLNNGVSVSGFNIEYDLLSIGAYGFLDTKSFELSIGPSYGMVGFGGSYGLNLFQLDINFLWKFPLDLPIDKFSIFPMLGISYNQPLFEFSGDYEKLGILDFGQLGLLVGVGLDYNLTSALYLRGEGLFHFRFPLWGAMDFITEPGVKFDFGMGPRIKLGVGYRL